MIYISMTKNYDVQSIFIDASSDTVFEFVANPRNLPKWTKAFTEADEQKAVMATPNGKLTVDLDVKTSRELGVIDWHMTMPDGGGIAAAYSRVTPAGKGSVYTFVLMAPPVPIEEVEGTLNEQIKLLREELDTLRGLLSR